MLRLLDAIYELLEYIIKYRKHPICKYAYLRQVEKEHTEVARNSFTGGAYYRRVYNRYVWSCRYLEKMKSKANCCDNIKNYECARYEVGDLK